MSMKGVAKRVPFLLSTEPWWVVGRFTIPLLVVAFLLLSACHRQPAKPLSEFESAHQRAQQQNPPELKVELRTRDGKSGYQLYETIPIDLVFTSKKLAAFSIELDEVMNGV